MKVTTVLILIIIVLSLLTAGSVMTAIIFKAQGTIAVLKMKLDMVKTEDSLKKNIVSKEMRDDILKDIKIQIPFKNLTKIGIAIDKWEQLREMEKAK